jgi:protein O-GlcNAc transferase
MGKLEFAQRLDDAVKMAESGQKAEAESLLRALVAEGARIPKATMALGVLCGERGDLAQRRVWFQEARRLEEATGDPPSLRLLLNLLVDALEQGEPELAITYGEEVLALDPEDGEAQFHLARAYSALGNELWVPVLQKACEQLILKLKKHPEDVRAWRLLATAQHNAERVDAAIEAYTSALYLEPNHLPSLLTISRLLIGRGQSDAALPWLMNALAIAPDDPAVLTLNGIALRDVSGASEAIPILRQTLKACPNYKEASIYLSGCLYDIGLFAEASEVLEKALESFPGDLELKMGLASAWRNIGKHDKAMPLYREVFEGVSGNQLVFNNLMFTYSISDNVSPGKALEDARQFWKRKGIDSRMENASGSITVRANSVLKVGILSADIGNHVVGRFLDPLLRHHDRHRCRLELISMKRRYESDSEDLISLADNFFSLEGLSIEEGRKILKRQNFDLIVDTSGYTNGSGLHLLADRCAPVQAHYIGYHATTGLPTIDWFIGDEETAGPELQCQFSEQLWRLPRPWLAYPKHLSFPEAKSYMDVDKLILGSFCQVSKMTETTLVIWSEILRRLPDALLVLKSNGLQDKAVKDFLEKRLENYGVSAERVRMIPPVAEWSDHLDFYNILDIALDTTPWSSATTGFEALGMGVPLVALRGDRMVARMSSSLVKGLGHCEWVAHSAEEAVNIIEDLGQSITNLRENKKRLQEEALASVLWDGYGLCKELENAFSSMCFKTSA